MASEGVNVNLSVRSNQFTDGLRTAGDSWKQFDKLLKSYSVNIRNMSLVANSFSRLGEMASQVQGKVDDGTDRWHDYAGAMASTLPVIGQMYDGLQKLIPLIGPSLGLGDGGKSVLRDLRARTAAQGAMENLRDIRADFDNRQKTGQAAAIAKIEGQTVTDMLADQKATQALIDAKREQIKIIRQKIEAAGVDENTRNMIEGDPEQARLMGLDPIAPVLPTADTAKAEAEIKAIESEIQRIQSEHNAAIAKIEAAKGGAVQKLQVEAQKQGKEAIAWIVNGVSSFGTFAEKVGSNVATAWEKRTQAIIAAEQRQTYSNLQTWHRIEDGMRGIGAGVSSWLASSRDVASDRIAGVRESLMSPMERAKRDNAKLEGDNFKSWMLGGDFLNKAELDRAKAENLNKAIEGLSLKLPQAVERLSDRYAGPANMQFKGLDDSKKTADATTRTAENTGKIAEAFGKSAVTLVRVAL